MFTQAQHAGGRSPMLYRIPKPAETTTAQHNPVRPRVLGLSQVQSQTRYQPGRLNPGSLQACLGLGYPTARLTVTQLLYDRLYTGSRLKGLLGRPKRALLRYARLLIHPTLRRLEGHASLTNRNDTPHLQSHKLLSPSWVLRAGQLKSEQ